MAEKGGTEKKKKILIVIMILLIIIISFSGCINILDKSVNINYWVYYDETLDFSKITKILAQNNISYTNNGDVISILFGKGISNDSIEKTEGTIWRQSWTTSDYPSEMVIELDDETYPWLKNNGNIEPLLDKRKPILENSYEYISTLIYNATGLWPIQKKFHYTDG